VRVFITKILYTLVLGFAGFGLFSGWTAAKEFLSKNLVEETKVVQKVSPVKPDFARNHPVYSMQARKKDEFTFFNTLNDPTMEKMVGLKGRLISSSSSGSETRPDKSAMPASVNLKKHSNIQPRIVQVASSHSNPPASLPVKQVKRVKRVTAQGGRFTVQVSSFKDMKYAETMASKLEQKGYPAFVRPIQLPNGQIWYRVNIGKYPDRDSAQLSALEVQVKEAFKTMVIPLSG
jgi:cell division septation protein DedD